MIKMISRTKINGNYCEISKEMRFLSLINGYTSHINITFKVVNGIISNSPKILRESPKSRSERRILYIILLYLVTSPTEVRHGL